MRDIPEAADEYDGYVGAVCDLLGRKAQSRIWKRIHIESNPASPRPDTVGFARAKRLARSTAYGPTYPEANARVVRLPYDIDGR